MIIVSAGAASQQPASIWKDPPLKIRLATGLDCIYQKDQMSPTTIVQLFVRAGKSAVSPGKDGLAYLTTRLTLEIPDADKARNLMIQATRMRVAVFEDFAIISLECLSENLEGSLAIMSDIVQDPLFSGLRIDRVKKIMALMGKAQDDDDVEAGHAAALRAFFDGRGCGGAVYGTPETIKALTKKDVTGFYENFFTKEGLFFTVSSDLGPEKIGPLLADSFREIPARRQDVETAVAAPALPAETKVNQEKDTKQTYIARAFALPSLTSSDYARGLLLETLLGRGPGSRLWDLRAKDKLAYNVNARTTWTRGGGILEVYLETDKAKAERAAASLARTVQAVFEAGTTAEELAMTKALAKATFLRANETKLDRVRTMGFFEAMGLGADFLMGVPGALEAVTLEEMNAFIRGALDPARALDILVGPKPAAQ